MIQGLGKTSFNILDFFPGLQSSIMDRRYDMQQRLMERGQDRVMGLLGEEATPFEDINESTQFADVSEGAGLLANPESFANQMKFSLGLMATPGYGGYGQQFASQALQHQLGMPLEMMKQQQQAQMDAIKQQREAQLHQMKVEKHAQDVTQANFGRADTLRDDAMKELQPYRESVEIFDGVQNTINARGGFNNMTKADDIQLMKGYAKMLLPREAVMSDDLNVIAQTDSLDSVVRGLMNKVNMGVALTAPERRQIYDSLYGLGQQRVQNYQQTRQDYEDRSARMGLNPADVLRTGMAVDMQNMSQQYPGRKAGPAPLPPDQIPDDLVPIRER